MTVSVPPAEEFGQYEIERELGRGAMGTVYLARDRRIGRRVALKTIKLSTGDFEDASSAKAYMDRLQREAEVCGALHHPNIVTLYEAGYRGDRIAYLAIEYVEGETLLAAIRRQRPDPLPLELVIRTGADVLRGLAYAHAQNIIHRDIKPANVLIAAGGTAKIADFGIARPQNSSLTAKGALMGTPNYMAPEQVLGQELIPRADIFSTGVMLFEMLTGTKPFAASDVTVVLHNVLRTPTPRVADFNRNVPPLLDELAFEMMAKSPLDRPTAEDALRRLEAIGRHPEGGVARPPSRSAALWKRPVPRNAAAALIAAAVLVAGVPAVLIVAASASRPEVTIPAERLREFEQKRVAMTEAQEMLAAGKYAESVARFDAYLARYPYSTAASEGKAIAQRMIEESEKKQASRRRRSSDEDISPRELLKRMTSVFRR